jgi:hypothetical protein
MSFVLVTGHQGMGRHEVRGFAREGSRVRHGSHGSFATTFEREAERSRDVDTVAEFWRVVRDAINSNSMTARLCVLLLIMALLGFAWHR